MSRRWVTLLDPLYGLGLRAKNATYDRGWQIPKRLQWPVVSVGNLSTGGAGKTPLTIRLAELLSADGFEVDVLSRGYGRASRAVERVDPAGIAARFGDEPLLIARRTAVPVFLGGSRFAAGLLAEAMAVHNPSNKRVHLLDDGFQHRQLARDVDVVVMHRTDFVEKLLPGGRLREPLAALSRANFAVLREEDALLEKELRRLKIKIPIWWMRRSLVLPRELEDSTERVLAFCGIARPEELCSSLTGAGVNLEETVEFPDHHRFTSDDMQRLVGAAKRIDAEAFVTTEKDAVKLDDSLRRILEAVAPVRVARLEVTLRDEALVVQQLREKLVAV